MKLWDLRGEDEKLYFVTVATVAIFFIIWTAARTLLDAMIFLKSDLFTVRAQ